MEINLNQLKYQLTLITFLIVPTLANANISIYSHPDNNSNIVGKINPNSDIEVSDGKWVEIINGGNHGWIKQKEFKELTGQQWSCHGNFKLRSNNNKHLSHEKHESYQSINSNTQESGKDFQITHPSTQDLITEANRQMEHAKKDFFGDFNIRMFGSNHKSPTNKPRPSQQQQHSNKPQPNIRIITDPNTGNRIAIRPNGKWHYLDK